MTADPVRQAAEALLDALDRHHKRADEFTTTSAIILSSEALRAALDAPPRGVTELEINQALNAGWTQGAVDPVFWHKPAVAALLPLFERYGDQRFAEGIEAAAVVALEHRDGNPTAVAPMQWWGPRIAASIRSLAPVARDDGWQPIETAPRDGKRVLLWNGHWCVHAGWWTDPKTETSGWVLWREDVGSENQLIIWGRGLPFTHWRPLPAPPAQGGE